MIALFGATGVGKTTVAEVLKAASKKDIAIVGPDAEFGDYRLADVVIVDALRNAEDVKRLIVENHIGAPDGPGCVVRVESSRDLDRAAAINIEVEVLRYMLPYRWVMNEPDDLEAAVGQLARICKVRS